MLPLVTNIREAFKNGQDDEQNFIQNLALFLCTFLKDHAVLIEPKVSFRKTISGVSWKVYMFTGCNFPRTCSLSYRTPYWRYILCFSFAVTSDLYAHCTVHVCLYMWSNVHNSCTCMHLCSLIHCICTL